MKNVILLILAVLLVSCNSKAEISKVKTSSKEEYKMTANNIQPFANPQLNSLIQNDLTAGGILASKLEYNTKDIPGGPTSLLLLNDSIALIDHSIVFFVIDVFNNKVIGFNKKSPNTFIIVGEQGNFYAFASYRLLKLKLESFREFPPKEHYFVPGLGEYSELAVFIPKSDTYIVGTQSFGSPLDNLPVFGLLEKGYQGYKDLWNLTFDGFIPRPPVSIDGNIVVTQNNLVSIVDSNGKVKEIKTDFIPISCSIGADNLIYMLCRVKNRTFIKAMDFDGNIHWECQTSINQPNQPPIVSKESMVYLIGSSKIEAFSNGEKKWEFRLTGSETEHQQASVSNDGILLVSDCDKLLCINKAGKQVWAFKVAEGETIMTQPVLDSVGKVFIATDKKILAIK
ncbi:MAG: hypothetical protein ACPL7B_03440 [Candidatus Poribacteria bacterium]